MAQRSMRSRLGQSGGDKTMPELFAAGWRWEGLRACWFRRYGNEAMAQDCIGRQRYFQHALNETQDLEK